jgi:tetratricopeptide (TPR) repeat protein
MNEAFSCNNMGVSLLLEGKHALALKCFSQAARSLYRSSFRSRMIEDTISFDGTILVTEVGLKPTSTSSSSADISKPANLSECVFTRKDEHSLYVYTIPFILTDSASMRNESTMAISSSVIVIFNMALCHDTAWRMYQSSNGFESNAIKLYEMACCLAIQNCEDRCIMDKIVTACLNNLGCLFYGIGEYENSRLYSEHLTLFLSHRDNSSDDDDARWQRKEYLLNLMQIQSAHFSASAA